MMEKQFKVSEFETYYFGSSKYQKKEQLFRDFRYVVYDYGCKMGSYPTAKEVNDAVKKNKKDIKLKLQGKGHTTQAIDAFLTAIIKWSKANM